MDTSKHSPSFQNRIYMWFAGFSAYGQGMVLLLVIVMIGLLRYFMESVLHQQYVCLLTVIYIVFYVHWMYRTRLRFPQKYARRFIIAISGLFVFFEVVRLIKWDFSVYQGTVERYMWYLYYVPITLLPTLNIHTLLHIDLPDNAARSRWWYLMHVPALGMLAGVLTNDLHQLAFRFPADMVDWELHYAHGPLFNAVTAWVVLGIVVMLVITVKMCINRSLYKNLWMPAAVVLIGLTYRLTYAFRDGTEKFFLQQMYEISDLMGLVWVVFWESLISTRLLPSNRAYLEVFSESTLCAGLADTAFVTRYRSAQGGAPTPEELRSAANGDLLLQDGDTALKARPVRGGWFYWTEDISALRNLQDALHDAAEDLLEENAFLQQKAQIDEDHRSTLHQTELYDGITQKILPQLQTLETMLSSVPAQEDAFRSLLKRAAVIYAFLKRYPNLLLLADAGKPADRQELMRCFDESANALRQLGAACRVSVSKTLQLPAETAAELYALFETAVEASLESISAVTAQLQQRDAVVRFSVSVQNDFLPEGYLKASALLQARAHRVGDARLTCSGNTLELSLVLQKEVLAV